MSSPQANTATLGLITRPIRKSSRNDIFINTFIKLIYLLINHNILSYNGYYKIINSANIKKLGQYRYWLSFFILAEFMILYCKDSLGCIDNNNIELINNHPY